MYKGNKLNKKQDFEIINFYWNEIVLSNRNFIIDFNKKKT